MDLSTVTEFLTVTDAAALRRAHDGDPATAVVAGGTWLFSVPQPHLRTLVDLTMLGWEPFTVSAAGIDLAATCPVASLESVPFAADWRARPLVRQCVRALLASFKVRSVATVGGNVCAALPAGAVTSLAVALDGVAELWDRDGGIRRLPVEEFVTGDRTTALAPGEVLRTIHLPATALRGTTAFRRTSLARLGRSATLVVGRRDPDGGFVLAVTASTPRPHVLRYDGVPSPTRVVGDVEDVVAGRWFDDVHGAPDWRRATTLRFAADVTRELSGASS